MYTKTSWKQSSYNLLNQKFAYSEFQLSKQLSTNMDGEKKQVSL